MPLSPLCDRVFITAIVFLIVATPFAFGAVQAWAYTAMEVVMFALVIVWMLSCGCCEHGAGSRAE